MSTQEQPRHTRQTLSYLGVALLFLFGLVLAFSRQLGAGWWWDIAGGLGFLALAYFILLNLATGQGARLGAHKLLGWWALGACLAHAGIYLYIDSVAINHLQLTAPPAMLVGIAATCIAVAGATLSLSRWKLKVHGSRDNFLRYHRIMSWVVLLGCLYHVVATGHSMHRTEQFLLLGVAVTVVLLLARKIAKTVQPQLPVLGLLLISAIMLVGFVGLRNV